MYTQQIIANVKAVAPNFTPQTILDYLNMIIEMVYSRDTYQTRFITESGMPPFLRTEDGKREYVFDESFYTRILNGESTPVRVRRTAAVFAKNAPDSNSYENRNALWSPYMYGPHEYFKLNLTSLDAGMTRPASLTFNENFNPGDTTATYYHLFYMMPEPLINTESQIPLPISTHFRLVPCLLSLLKNEEYGSDSAYEYIEQTLAKRIWKEMNQGAQGRLSQAVTPIEWRETYGTHYYQ